MFYDLFPVDARSQHNSSGERQLQRGFDIVTSVETVPSGSIKKFTSTGKRPEDERNIVRCPGRINILGVESTDLMAPCKLLAAKYDIVSVEPQDKKTLQLACTTLPVDLISINLDPSSKCAKIDGTFLTRATARNVYIELQIAAAVTSGRLEAAVATMATALAAKIPRHMLVISSGRDARPAAASPGQLVSMATLLGMRRVHAVLAASDNPAALMQHARLRRLRGTTVVHQG